VTRALVVQHLDVEGPYGIGAALAAAGVELHTCLLGRDQLPADLTDFDGLVVMGGPMAAYDDADFPSRHAELGLLAEAVASEVPTLGICLGAQLLAAAAGGQAVPGPAGPEIGWAPIHVDAGTDPLLAGIGPIVDVLHWHGDTIVLPPGATRLAASERYPNQAFRVGRTAWGLQFHLEVDREAVAAFVHRFHGDPAILTEADAHLARLAPARAVVTERFAALVADQVRRSRRFFAARAAAWDERFPDDGPAYAAAAQELDLVAGAVVLDVGCGTGRALPALAGAGAGLVIGVDVTPEMLAVARTRAATLVVGDAARLPLAGASVDAVFAAGLVTHLADPVAGLRELARVTRPGGRLAVFHPIARTALAARHGRDPGVDPVPDALSAAGWTLRSLEDGDRRYLAIATRDPAA
jgi:GMP synthase-like glutamine amidotransferase/SAM-dependent methyltransferase